MKKRLIYLSLGAIAVGALVIIWMLTVRVGYESAAYSVVKSEGEFELREYGDLMLVETDSEMDTQGEDGSFMRLFRYISGANGDDQKISMTIPVFMQDETEDSQGVMGFVLPAEVAAGQVPQPSASNVRLTMRSGGTFAVVRFSGQMSRGAIAEAEMRLRKWMSENELVGDPNFEYAGYDPPLTPGPFRRNEVMIRVVQDS